MPLLSHKTAFHLHHFFLLLLTYLYLKLKSSTMDKAYTGLSESVMACWMWKAVYFPSCHKAHRGPEQLLATLGLGYKNAHAYISHPCTGFCVSTGMTSAYNVFPFWFSGRWCILTLLYCFEQIAAIAAKDATQANLSKLIFQSQLVCLTVMMNDFGICRLHLNFITIAPLFPEISLPITVYLEVW